MSLREELRNASIETAAWPDYLRGMPLDEYETDILEAAIARLEARIATIRKEIERRQ